MAEYLRIIIQILLIAVLSVISFVLIRLSKLLKKERRLKKFTTPALSDKPKSFFDRFEDIYINIVLYLSNNLKNFSLFKKYSKRYEKYVNQTDKIRTSSMDIVSNKIVIANVTLIITLISDILRFTNISLIQILFSFVIGFFLPDFFLIINEKKKRKTMENDLLKAVTIMNNAFKTGRSIMQAVQLVYLEIDGPISDEFKKMYVDLTYGLELDEVFNRFSDRIDLDEVSYMSSALVILNKTGGDVVKVFNTIENGFFERKKLRQELKSATALSELVFKVLIIMPILIFVVIYIFNNDYFKPLITTIIGRIILVLILTIYIVYILVVNKISKFKD